MKLASSGHDPQDKLSETAAIYSGWLDTLEAVLDQIVLDRAHSDRLLAFHDSSERLVATAHSSPNAVRLGPVIGLRRVLDGLAQDLVDVRDEVDLIEFDNDAAFLASAEEIGALPATLARLKVALSAVDASLVGPSRVYDALNHVPDEIIHVPPAHAREWSLRGLAAVTDLEICVLHADGADHKLNGPAVRDAWTALTALAASLALIADNEALNARSFLTQISEAQRASERAELKLSRSKAVDADGDRLLGEEAFAALREVKDCASEGSKLVVDGFTSREEHLMRLSWRSVSRGRADVSEAEIRKLAKTAAPTILMAQSRLGPVDRLVKGMVRAAVDFRSDWSGAQA